MLKRTILFEYTQHIFWLREAQANMEETDKKDYREWNLTTVDPQERSIWRSGVRSTIHAVSQLPGRGHTDVDDAPASACESKI